ncbi:hypothetical protein, partial [Geitlerinema sp. PCC 9228]|uniref:hypothetical protein n=1 Tax=Geitlerinema sp. PCC 9228 TaxID=111611 RepID=UPI001114C92B
TTKNLPKKHWLDAACVGKSTPKNLKVKEPLLGWLPFPQQFLPQPGQIHGMSCPCRHALAS